MNGIRRGDEVIYITHLQGYKKPVLMIGNKSVIQKIASFDSDEYAEGFSKMLNQWFGIEEKEISNATV